MCRGYTATAFDGWLRLTHAEFRARGRGRGALRQRRAASLIPGVLLRQPVESTQFGAALESELGAPEDAVSGGLDAGSRAATRAGLRR